VRGAAGSDRVAGHAEPDAALTARFGSRNIGPENLFGDNKAASETLVRNTELTIRDYLLAEVRLFVEYARVCPGVRRIALIGSLTTEKSDPKDADLLVTVDDDADLTPLATAGRKLKGTRAEQE
jgi:hypothetical protein